MENRRLICVEKGNERKDISISEFEKMTRIPFISSIEFEREKDLKKINKMIEKLHKKGALPKEQLWLGSFYKKEMLSQFIPKIVLRYIDPEIGWGVFADQDFKKGDFIAEYSGVVRKRKWRDRKNAYCFEYLLASGVSSSFLIDAEERGGLARYVNHSQNPNLTCVLVTFDFLTHVVLIAEKPILKGSQLCYDYGSSYWAHRGSPKEL